MIEAEFLVLRLRQPGLDLGEVLHAAKQTGLIAGIVESFKVVFFLPSAERCVIAATLRHIGVGVSHSSGTADDKGSADLFPVVPACAHSAPSFSTFTDCCLLRLFGLRTGLVQFIDAAQMCIRNDTADTIIESHFRLLGTGADDLAGPGGITDVEDFATGRK